MRVIVIGDVAHVVVHVMNEPKVRIDHQGKLAMHVVLQFDRRRRIVLTPYHHRYCADLAFGDPAHIVLVEPWRNSRGLTQVAIA